MEVTLFDPDDFRNYINDNGNDACKEQVTRMTNSEMVDLVAENIDWDRVNEIVDLVAENIDWDRVNEIVGSSFTSTMYELEGLNPPDNFI